MDIENLLEEYTLDFGMWSEVDERLAGFNNIGLPDKIILVLYAETRSYRKVGKILGVSHQTIAKVINKIRKKLC